MAEIIKLTPKTQEALDIIKANGGKMTTEELRVALGVEKIASVTGRVNSLCAESKQLAYREKGEAGADGKVPTYVILTDAGMAYTAPVEE